MIGNRIIPDRASLMIPPQRLFKVRIGVAQGEGVSSRFFERLPWGVFEPVCLRRGGEHKQGLFVKVALEILL